MQHDVLLSDDNDDNENNEDNEDITIDDHEYNTKSPSLQIEESQDYHNLNRDEMLVTPQPPKNNSTRVGQDYELLKTLGEGTFGTVKLGKDLRTGELRAIKILEKSRISSEGDTERVKREIQILKNIEHQHVIKLYEIIETEQRIYLIMEHASGGELFDYIVDNERLQEREACQLYLQILSGIEFFHKRHMALDGQSLAHRDLKPENLLFAKPPSKETDDESISTKVLKIIDFGLSNTYRTGQTLETACGSPCYAAPEMLEGKRYDGLKVDIWSSGVTLYAMLCGFLPFEDPDTAMLYK